MLETVDRSLRIDQEAYQEELLSLAIELRKLAFDLYREQRPLVVVYEGWDAAGKGGNIRRMTEKLDPRGFDVFAVAAPEGDEKRHHYLWRFWRLLRPPQEKQILIFDRSWYGRVLVERVEGFATEEEWRRAYDEINDFERQLLEADFRIAKFWIHISPEEQEARFEARSETPHKRWKLTDEDWRNRAKWSEYEAAVEEMIERTSPPDAPWTLIAGNDKPYARIATLRHIVELLSKS
jgi:polyphosphate kinase 2 (PPK2 family)